MSNDAHELIPEYVLGLLAEDERRRVAGAVQGSAALEREVRRTENAVAALADALPDRAPLPGGRARLLATLSSPTRFQAFFPTLRQWFDLSDEQLCAVIARMDDGAAFVDAPLPGVRYFDFQAGPRALGKEAGVLTLAAGARFPAHVHHGGERSMILEGTLLLDGRSLHPGDVVEVTAGARHAFAAGPERRLALLVIHDGISLG